MLYIFVLLVTAVLGRDAYDVDVPAGYKWFCANFSYSYSAGSSYWSISSNGTYIIS